MSLYNSLFEENEDTNVLLGMLGVNKAYFERFRDVDLIKNGTIIRVLTRLGGGNREAYEDTWYKIYNNSLYLEDYDDDFDCTYAYIEFKIPEKYIDTAKKMFKEDPVDFEEKFMKSLEDMDKKGTKENETMNKLTDALSEALEKGESGIIEI